MNYTFLLQNTTTKETDKYILEDLNPDGLYYKFQIELEDPKEAEYQYLLIENPEQVDIEIDVNNIFNSLLIGYPTKIVATGLLRIGMKESKLTYNKSNSYIAYGE